LENASNVALEIYNLKGQLVKTLLNGPSQSGSHSVVWNGRDSAGHAVSSGMYYCRVTTGNYTGTKKMIMIK
jgi:flagellar hook assembly protein FlgD